MKKRVIVISFALCLMLGVAAYVLQRFSVVRIGTPTLPPKPPALTILQAPPARQPTTTTGFEPPPRVVPTNQPNPEPRRTLIGATNEQLKQIERYLPEGAQVATYPASETEERGAFASTDLAGDGGMETVLVYRAPGPAPDGGGQPFFLGVLAPEENRLTLRASTRLYGGLIYISLYDEQAVPFAVRDVTGDGRPEIVVSSGIGASLGGALQIYSFDGSALHQLANAGGHTLRVYDTGKTKPSEITAQSRYQDKPEIYRWNGQRFEQTNGTGKR